MKRVILSSILILSFIIAGTTVAILYARGYRLLPQNGRARIEGTGLLVLTSKPDGARVIINDHLSTATNNTINLSPGEYDVRIEKDGYIPWTKKITVKKEVVSEAIALLFPIAPKLEAITTTGAGNPVLDASGSLIAYTVSSSSAVKNGVYLLDMSARSILSFGGQTSQIANNSTDRLSNSTLAFSPDGKELIASVNTNSGTTSYLLSAKGFNDVPKDVTNTISQVQKEWEALLAEKNKKILDSFQKDLRPIVTDYFKDFSISPEGDKVLYTASQSATLAIIKTPRIIGGNSTPEQRTIKKGNTYVYDIKEDRNFLLFDRGSMKEKDLSPNFMWHPDSRHLIYAKDGKINILEYDAQNQTTVYAGPFLDSYVFPWTDGVSLIILAKLNNPNVPYNLYRIGLE